LHEKISMTPEYFDIHSHLNFDKYDADRDAVIEHMRQEKCSTTTIGTGLKTSEEAIALADKYEHLFATIGLHPTDTQEGFVKEDFEKLITHSKVVAVGECGLDYARISEAKDSELEKKIQKDIFEQHIELAVAYNKPLMIHCRDAYPDALEILKSKQKVHGENVRGNFHFFTSPVDIAKQCLDIGFTVSFTGVITFVKEYAEIVEYVPLEHMMSETDAPFAAPVPHRGKRNEPLYVKEVVKKIAEIKNKDLEEVKKILVENALNFFSIAA